MSCWPSRWKAWGVILREESLSGSCTDEKVEGCIAAVVAVVVVGDERKGSKDG